MPIKDSVVYIDNTYLKDISTCSTKGWILRVIQHASVDKDLEAAHAGTSIHEAIREFVKAQGNKEQALARLEEVYLELIPDTDPWEGIQMRRNPDVNKPE